MTVIPYSTTAHARATAPTRVDKLLIRAGTGIAAWGARRAARRSSRLSLRRGLSSRYRRKFGRRKLPSRDRSRPLPAHRSGIRSRRSRLRKGRAGAVEPSNGALPLWF